MNAESLVRSEPNTSVYASLQRRETENTPIRVGIIGAGATGRAIVLQLGQSLSSLAGCRKLNSSRLILRHSALRRSPPS